jgi:aminoglycoside 6'-N-acetyltransferase I
MRHALWPSGSEEEHRRDVEQYMAGVAQEPAAALLAEDGIRAVGFVELSIRAYAEGCHSQGVAYVEGWYVEPRARRQGVGRALIAAAEDWGRAQGCTEIASDSHPENEVSAAAHLAAGFTDAGFVRCFHKDI